MSSFLKVVLKESPLDSPFAPKSKRWWMAAVAAASAIFDGIMNTASGNSVNNANADMNKANIDAQKDINEKNIAFQKETNAQNYKMFQEQNAFNLDMWNKENQYNSPASQVQRLLAAGINPASQFGSSTGSLASSLTSANPNPAGAPHLDAPQNYFEARQYPNSQLANGATAAINAYNQNRLASAEIRNKEALTGNTILDNTFKERSMLDRLKELRNIASGSGWQAEMAKKQLDFYQATMDYDIQMKMGDYRMQQKSMERLDKELRYMDLQADILEITKGYASQMNQAQIASLWSSVHQANAQIGLINANKLLTDEQRLHEVEKKTSTIIDNGMKGLDLDIKKAVKESIIQNYKNSANVGMYEAFDKWRYNSKGDSRPVSDQFGVDNLGDILKRQFQRHGFKPHF